MKQLILLVIFLFFISFACGQEKEKTKEGFPFDEFSIFVDRTNVSSYGTEDRFGCGAGIYHAFTPKRPFTFMAGIEYNYTSQYVGDMAFGHFYREYNMTVHIHNISLPLSLRYSIGKNVKYFFGGGFFLDLAVNAKKKGMVSTYYMDGTHNTSETSIDISFPLNYGPSFEMGIRIPMKGIEWIVKADYKWGLNEMDADGAYIHNQYYRLAIGVRRNASRK